MAEPVACVVNGLDWSSLQAGDRVAVVGAGFMGLLLIQGLRFTLSAQVIAVDIDDHRLALAFSRERTAGAFCRMAAA